MLILFTEIRGNQVLFKSSHKSYCIWVGTQSRASEQKVNIKHFLPFLNQDRHCAIGQGTDLPASRAICSSVCLWMCGSVRTCNRKSLEMSVNMLMKHFCWINTAPFSKRVSALGAGIKGHVCLCSPISGALSPVFPACNPHWVNLASAWDSDRDRTHVAVRIEWTKACNLLHFIRDHQVHTN